MSSAMLKAAGQCSAVSCTISRQRVQPFKPLTIRSRSSKVVAHAAAVDDLEEGLDFSFSDAKRNNDYSNGDVEAALRYYEDGEGSAPAFEADFVTNVFGQEDASFFADIDDDTEGYRDEYMVAGIPEAAPKRRGRARAQADAQGDDDDMEQAKALDKVKALEDRMVLDAALEEEFADGGKAIADASATETAGVWDWLVDLEDASGADAQEVQEEVEAQAGATAAVQLSDRDVNADLLARQELLQDTEVPVYLELFANEDLSEEVLAAVEESTDVPEGLESSLTNDDLTRIDELINQEIPVLSLEAAAGPAAPRLEDSPELERAVVDQYIETLRAAVKGTEGASEDDVKAVFGEEPLTVEQADAEEDAAAQKEYQSLLATPEPQIQDVTIDVEAEAAAIEDMGEEPAEDDDGGLERELLALQAIEEWREEEYPTDEYLDSIEGYVVSAEDYVAQEEQRKAAIAQAVAAGELSPDVLAEELEEVPDAVDEVMADKLLEGADDEEDVAIMAMGDEEEGEGWVERIIELTRVTKVVKGGKIMGFRCVAIVGNQNGLVGVGCQAGREVAVAVKRTLVDAKRNVVKVPLVGAGTVPHRSEAKYHAARTLVLPASDGTGCIAGGSVRSVLELAGVKNCLAKRLGSRSALNSARATVKALTQMQTLYDVSKARGVPMEQLLLQ